MLRGEEAKSLGGGVLPIGFFLGTQEKEGDA